MPTATRSSLSDHGDDLDAGVKQKIEDALTKVDEAIKGDDKEAIDKAVNELQQAGAELYQKSRPRRPRLKAVVRQKADRAERSVPRPQPMMLSTPNTLKSMTTRSSLVCRQTITKLWV